MKIQYFADTDTLLVTFQEAPVAETKELDENTLIDVDEDGNLVSITLEHAKGRTDIANFSYQQIGVLQPA
ncbi:MAG: DUF2283 domain-containing protein [Chloroflexi bacterium]|nr:DUF2283 domain-containing protein [Chloroflexota bacterium]